MSEKILVSACLVGINCKYDGTNNENKKILKLLEDKNIFLVCPEQLGGLPTPRIPAEKLKNKVIRKDGKDITEEYLKGAEEVLKIANKFNIKKAILKSRSPSCGKGKIYDGTFTNTLIDGNGVTADLLLQNKVEVIQSDDI